MAKLKLRTRSRVVIRKDPSRNANMDNAKGELYANQEFELDVEEVSGTDGEIWYKDKNGDYLWSGGFEMIKPPVVDISILKIDSNLYVNPLQNIINYNKIFEFLPSKWSLTKGKGIKVAILDTGICRIHPDLNIPVSNIINFTKSVDEDTIGHGTHCAGLISGNSQSTYGIVGLAPLCEIYSAKVLNDNLDDDEGEEPIIKGLDWAIKNQVDIVNLSLKVKTGLVTHKLKEKIEETYEQGIFIITAAGDNLYIRHNLMNIPAIYPKCISVGAISEYYYEKIKDTVNKNVSFILPYLDLYSTDLPSGNFYNKRVGCSMSTAQISGLIALILSFEKSRGNYFKAETNMSDVIQLIKNISKDFFTEMNFNKLKIYKLTN